MLINPLTQALRRLDNVLALLLIGVFLLSLSGWLRWMNMHVASWIAFLAILITPGFLITQMITARIPMDWLQRLSLAFPVGITLVAIPGLPALLLHWTFQQLLWGWIITNFGVIMLWGIYFWKKEPPLPENTIPWQWHEMVLGVFLIVAFALAFPALTTYQMDGDNLTFLTKVTDALAGIPINLHESIFGTEMEVGVRSAVSQFLPLWVLWTHLTQLDPVTLTAYTTRTMLAIWTILATYTLGKEVGNGKRDMGLLAASLQMIIYLAEIFFRGDNVSLFFMLRTNADKFTVSVTMLPVVAAMGIHYLREHSLAAWWVGLLAAFAVSSIHPLIAAMTALALGALGGVHLLFNLRSKATWHRVLLLGVMAGVTMFLPIVLLFVSRGSHALAPTYPRSFEGWPLGEEIIPVLPYYRMTNLDIYGPVPTLETVSPEEGETNTSPFLIWRYFLNMRRRRLIISDIHDYISDPNLLVEPPFLLALGLIPFLAIWIRKHIGVQYVVSVTLAMVFFMFNPIVTPIIGGLVVPWLLWRFIWMMPYVFAISLALSGGVALLARWLQTRRRFPPETVRGVGLVTLVLGAALLFSGNIRTNLNDLTHTEAGPRVFPTPYRILAYLNEKTIHDETPVMVAANQDLSVTIPVYAARVGVIGHRIFNISEFFPADEQNTALARLIDQHALMNTPYLTENSIRILTDYKIKYMIVESASELDFQLQLSPWAAWIMDDQIFSLYEIRGMPSINENIRGNSALLAYRWPEAEQHFLAAIEKSPSDQLALAGLATVYENEGRFPEAIETLLQLAQRKPMPAVDYQLGRLYVNMGEFELGITHFQRATENAPDGTRYFIALGDACLRAGQDDCARKAFEKAATLQGPDGDATRLIFLARLWAQRGKEDMAIPLYEQGVALFPSVRNRFLLITVYQNATQFDKAQTMLETMQKETPLNSEIFIRLARLFLLQEKTDEAIAIYHKALALQALQAQDDTRTRLLLVQAYLTAGNLEDAENELQFLQAHQPYNAMVYLLLGNLRIAQNRPADAIAEYQRAIELNPTTLTAYTSLSTQYQEQATLDENLDLLSTAAQTNPNQPRLFISWANQLQQLGDSDRAIEVYQISLRLLDAARFSPRINPETINRDRAVIFGRLAGLYEEQGETQKALDFYATALVATPLNPSRWVAYGDALRRQKQLDEAEEAYRHAIQTDSSFLLAYLQLAELLQARGESEQARTMYEEAINTYLAQPEQLPRAITQLTLDSLTGQYALDELVFGSATDWEILDDSLFTFDMEALTPFLEGLEAGTTTNSLNALARIYQRLGEVGQAIALYQANIEAGEAAHLSPATLSQYYSGLGEIYAGQLEYEKAAEAYQQASALNPYAVSPRVGLANVYNLQGQTEAAIETLQAALDLSPASVEAQLARARLLNTQGETAQALEIYQAIAKQYPGNVSASLALARTLQEQGRLQEAENIYTRLIHQQPGNLEAYLELANLYIATARYEQAEELLGTALEIDQSDAGIYLSLGTLFTRQLRYPSAIDAFSQAIERAPRQAEAYVRLANLYQILGSPDEARDILNLAVQADPTGSDALLALAALYQEQNHPDQAERALHLAVQRATGNPGARGALANFYRTQNQPELALEQRRLAVEEFPTSMEALGAYANELRRQNFFTEAGHLYEQAEAESAPTPAGLRTLAAVYQDFGDNASALRLLQKALDLFPTDLATWIQLGRLQAATGNLQLALQTLQQAKEIAPFQASVWTALGDLQLASGLREDAIQSFNIAIQTDPAFLPAYASLLRAYPPSEDPFQTAKIITQARQALPGSYRVDLLEAQFHLGQLQWKAAENALLRAIQKAPGLAEPYLALAGLYVRLGQYPDAITAYETAATREPGNPGIYLNLARGYQTLGQTDKAFETLQLAIQLDATNPASLLALSNLYQEQNQPAQAEQTLLQALESAPGTPDVRMALANFYRAQGALDKTLEQLRLSAEETPSNPEMVIAYANELWRQNQFSQAEALYQLAENTSPLTPTGLRALAAARQAQGQFQEAATLLQKALELDPSDAVTWAQWGRLNVSLENFELALEAMHKATELTPDQPTMWQTLGEIQLSLGQREGALASFEQALAIQPTFIPAYGALLEAFPVSQFPDEVSQILEDARTMAPGDFRVALYQARVLQAQLRREEAILVLEEAFRQTPGIPEISLSLGDLTAQTGNYVDALIWYPKAIEADPSNGRAYVGLANVYLNLGDLAKTFETLQSGLKLNPSSIDILLSLATLYQTQDQSAEAESALKTAFTLAPGNPATRNALVEFYRVRNQGGLALELTRQSWEARPNSLAALIAYANELQRQGQSTQAEYLYLQAEQLPATSAGLRALAAARAANENFDAAIALLYQVLELAPWDASTWVQLGQVQFSQGDTTNALFSLERAITLAPDQVRGWQVLGTLQLVLGSRQAAIATLNQAREIEPANMETYGLLLEAYPVVLYANQAAEVIAAAQEAAPGSYLGDIFETRHHQALLEWTEAEIAIQRALTKAPGSVEPYIALGNLLIRMGRSGDAAKAFEQALLKEPGNVTAQNRLTLTLERILLYEESQIQIELKVISVLALLNAEAQNNPSNIEPLSQDAPNHRPLAVYRSHQEGPGTYRYLP